MYQVLDGNPALVSDPTLARWGKALKAGGQEAGDAMNELISAQANNKLPAADQGPEDRRPGDEVGVAGVHRQLPRNTTSPGVSRR